MPESPINWTGCSAGPGDAAFEYNAANHSVFLKLFGWNDVACPTVMEIAPPTLLVGDLGEGPLTLAFPNQVVDGVYANGSNPLDPTQYRATGFELEVYWITIDPPDDPDTSRVLFSLDQIASGAYFGQIDAHIIANETGESAFVRWEILSIGSRAYLFALPDDISLDDGVGIPASFVAEQHLAETALGLRLFWDPCRKRGGRTLGMHRRVRSHFQEENR